MFNSSNNTKLVKKKANENTDFDLGDCFKDTISGVDGYKTKNEYVIAASSWDGTCRCFTLDFNFKQKGTKELKKDVPVLCICHTSPNNFIIGDAKGCIEVWDTTTNKTTLIYTFSDTISCLKFNKQRNEAIATSINGEIALINILTMEIIVAHIAFKILTFDCGNSLVVFNCGKFLLAYSHILGRFIELKDVGYEKENMTEVNCLVYNESEKIIVRGFTNGSVHVNFKKRTKNHVIMVCDKISLGKHEVIFNPVNCICFANNQLIVGCSSGRIKVFSNKDSFSELQYEIKSLHPNSSVCCLKYINDSNVLVYGVGYDWSKGIYGIGQNVTNRICLKIIE